MRFLLVALLCTITAHKQPALGDKGQVLISGTSALGLQKAFGDPAEWDFDLRPAAGGFLTEHVVIGGGVALHTRSAMASTLASFTAGPFVGYHLRFANPRWSLLPTVAMGGGFTRVSSQMGAGVVNKVFVLSGDVNVLWALAGPLQLVVSPYLTLVAQTPGTTGEYGVRVGFLGWL